MTPEPCTVTEDDSIETVVELMERHRVKRLPVLRDGRLVGVVSRADLMNALIELARYRHTQPADDETIRSRLLAALSDMPWAVNVNVTVRGGAVDLSGIVTDERERKGLIVAAENIAGVKEVHDHLVWVEPYSGTSLPSPEDEAKAQAGRGAPGMAH